jgi:hypothetical protein
VGNCELTKLLDKNGFTFKAVDGVNGGIQLCTSKGISPNNLLKHDLRLPLETSKRYDMLFSTEIAEHIEPPFSSQFVHNCVKQSDLVWFSYENDEIDNQNHIHHSNEQPAKFWINLFAFFGYKYVFIDPSYLPYFEHRGGLVFYNAQTIILPFPYKPGDTIYGND